MTLPDCATVMKQVRAFFATGHKSTNKRYYVDHDGNFETDLDKRLTDIQLQKAVERRLDSKAASKYRTPYNPSRIGDAETMLKMPYDHRSGNCDEMSSLSAYFALKVHNVPQSHLYIATIKEPGDHVFCVIADAEITAQNLKLFPTVTDFTQAEAAKKWMIIDPWLKVTCFGSDYLTNGNLQLNKWGTGGKRIKWEYGTQGEGWYNPDGEYKQKFAIAPVKLKPFT